MKTIELESDKAQCDAFVEIHTKGECTDARLFIEDIFHRSGMKSAVVYYVGGDGNLRVDLKDHDFTIYQLKCSQFSDWKVVNGR